MAATATLDGYARLLQRLDEVRLRRGRVHCAERAAFFVAVLLSALLVSLTLNALVPLPSLVRWAMLAGLAGFTLAGLALFVAAPLFRSWNDEQMAVHIEHHYPEISNSLISAVQLARDPLVPSRAFVEQLVRIVLAQMDRLNLRAVVDTRRLRTHAAWAAAALLALASLSALWPSGMGAALERLMHPGAYAATSGRVQILQVQPGHAAVTMGQSLSVTVTCAPPLPDDVQAVISASPGNGTVRREPMSRLSEERFAFTFHDIQEPFEYRVRVGRTETPVAYRVRIVQPPSLEQIDLEYRFPEYTGLPPALYPNSTGHVRALVGTRVVAAARFNKPIARGHALLSTGQRAAIELAHERTTGTFSFTVAADGSYSIHLTDDDGVLNVNPVIYTITAIPDNPPSVALTAPGRDVSLAVGESLDIAAEASDDIGLTEIGILFKPVKAEAVSPLIQCNDFPDPRKAICTFRWTFHPEQYQPGDAFVYSAYAIDNNRLARTPGLSKTRNFLVTLIDPSKRQSELDALVADWQRRLHAILEMQILARDNALELRDVPSLQSLRTGLVPIRKDQIAIRAETVALATQLDVTAAPALARLKDVLFALTGNEMADAVKLTETLDGRTDLLVAKDDLASLVQTQERIIELLKKVLDILPVAAAESARARRPEEKTSDLPTDARNKLDDLVDGLKDFLKDQSKVIEATTDLAKKPMEDLTEADRETLRNLAATEDNWSKFFEEAHSDLSKLPEMDFSNPALLKELVEIYTELQKAAESLTAGASEIAVAIGEAGLELAERLVDNIEKWIPEGADRTKWSMEEPIGDYEIPLADLPKELTDIIGDLMEEQEDLFEEMEDVTSAWADSANAVGWDVSDGPISNMAASGVTGNQLPNQQEVGGRSGEGFTAKASGEMVEEAATGKGGRDTPTRLTSEPFSEGQIEDTSNDPAGGSTGGGKVSGAGGEGLEGPAPPDFKDRFENLAQRQAQLLQTAEKIDLGFKILNYPSLFAPTRDQMHQVHVDLQNARYQNALRRKDIILKGLEKTRRFVDHTLQIRRDRSIGLPKNLQDEILDALAGPAPEGFEHLLQMYYEALSRAQ